MEISVLVEVPVKDLEVSWLRDVAERVLMAQGVGSDAELSLVITSQERVRQLNRSYRGKDAFTDVLSFAMTPEGTAFVTPPDGILHLGEVIISYPQAILQAEEHRHSLKTELAILITHGILHLLGYDHEKPGQRRQMRAREKAILGRIETEGLVD